MEAVLQRSWENLLNEDVSQIETEDLGSVNSKQQESECKLNPREACPLPKFANFRGPLIYFSLHEAGHLKDIDMILRINLNDYTYWCIPFGRSYHDCNEDIRTAQIELPLLHDGISYIAITCSIPNFGSADGSCRELMLGTQGYLLTHSIDHSSRGMTLLISDVYMVQSSNTSLPCAICQTTIHSSGEFCQSEKEIRLRQIYADFKPTQVMRSTATICKTIKEGEFHRMIVVHYKRI
eukprot:746706-Hanusia_phi.AAC.2